MARQSPLPFLILGGAALFALSRKSGAGTAASSDRVKKLTVSNLDRYRDEIIAGRQDAIWIAYDEKTELGRAARGSFGTMSNARPEITFYAADYSEILKPGWEADADHRQWLDRQIAAARNEGIHGLIDILLWKAGDDAPVTSGEITPDENPNHPFYMRTKPQIDSVLQHGIDVIDGKRPIPSPSDVIDPTATPHGEGEYRPATPNELSPFENMKDLQNALVHLGWSLYPEGANGEWNVGTALALKAFLHVMRMPEDPSADRWESRNALWDMANGSKWYPFGNLTGYQEALEDVLGAGVLSPYGADGKWGTVTSAATKKAQELIGLTKSGNPDFATRIELYYRTP